MATSMEADLEVHFKERQEGKGVKTETAVDDATLQFEFRASTPAASPSGRGAEHRGGDAEEPRRIELKKFSLRPEKYDGKVDFEGWVNQFKEYATLGQWTEEEKSSLLFLSLTAGARMYFVGLPEREKMAYATRVEALRHWFGQETDTSIALQELAGLRRGKNQSAKELADNARRLASRAYHSNDYASQEKAAGPQGGAATEESVTIGNGLYLLGRIGGSGVSFLVDTGSGVSILAARKWKEWGRTEDELTRYWRLCSVEGRALECLGKARLTVTLGTRVVEWGFIVAEIGDDEGILGNDFAMAHELTVRPCEGAMYLPDHAETGRGHLGERLPCTVRVVTEVRTITEETLAVRAVGPATLAPHAVTQVRVIVPTPRACGKVMVDRGPGPLGLCPVRGIVEVEQASNIWLANPGSQPIQLDGDEVVALAECVLAEPGASAGSDRDIGDEVNGLVERASPHLTSEECRQLQMAMAARKHLFAKGKGDLGRTDIVQHRIHTGDQPAIK